MSASKLAGAKLSEEQLKKVVGGRFDPEDYEYLYHFPCPDCGYTPMEYRGYVCEGFCDGYELYCAGCQTTFCFSNYSDFNP